MLMVACEAPSAGSDAPWYEARARWYEERDPLAWRAWHELGDDDAEQLLERADALYREGIARVDEGDPDARRSFEEALLIAPMDPRLNLPLARAFRRQADLNPDNPHLFIRAAFTYRKFLLLVPDDPDAPFARRELEQLDPEAADWLVSIGPEQTHAAPEHRRTESFAPWLAIASFILALATLVLLLVRTRRRTRSLEELASIRPELHPAIAYLVASLRHELLKHRIGAVASAIEAWAEGHASEPQLEFIRDRLFGGEPLEQAWSGHIHAFERALGPELDLHRRDRAFARAGKAISTIVRQRHVLRAGDPRAISRLRRAHEELRSLDRMLAALVSRLVRTRVDAALLRQIVDEVRSEYAPSHVALDALAIEAPDPAPKIEVFRVDLVLVLRNVVRNAIFAVERAAPPRKLLLDVRTELEITGEENVTIRVHDTSPEVLTTEQIYERRVGSGLGLVTGALSRYDGSIMVEPSDRGGTKAITLRFFRAFGDHEREDT